MWVAGRLVESGEAVRVAIDGARITRIDAVETAPPELWIAPGLIDIQVNGFGGHDVTAADVTSDVIRALTRLMWSHGITAYCPTVLTSPGERICHSVAAIAAACADDPLIARSIPCIHIEGPHISPVDGPRGVHVAAHVRPPDIAEYHRWQEAAGGRIGVVTLSPEYTAASDYIRAITADGVIAAIGHTAATGDQIAAAVRAGARLSTHLGNGAHELLPRHPNYLWDQMAEDRLMASFIFDTHHLPPAVMKAMLRAKGVTRAILVSDTVSMAGLPRGIYELGDGGGRVELLANGRLNLFGTPYLAGATLPLVGGLANAVRCAGVELAGAVTMASTNPARLLGLEARGHGHVRVGAAADLTVLRIDPATGTITPHTTIVGGEVVYRSEAMP